MIRRIGPDPRLAQAPMPPTVPSSDGVKLEVAALEKTKSELVSEMTRLRKEAADHAKLCEQLPALRKESEELASKRSALTKEMDGLTAQLKDLAAGQVPFDQMVIKLLTVEEGAAGKAKASAMINEKVCQVEFVGEFDVYRKLMLRFKNR